MNRRKKRFVMLLLPLAVVLLASLLAAQGPAQSMCERLLAGLSEQGEGLSR